jgi:hypothetical protein
VPVALAKEVGEAWLEAIDCFASGPWEISMYAFGLAVTKLKLKLALTELVTFNYQQFDSVNSARIIHYCYGDEVWNKRHYFSSRTSSRVWHPTAKAPAGTVLGEIIDQLHEAREYYSVRQVQHRQISQKRTNLQ